MDATPSSSSNQSSKRKGGAFKKWLTNPVRKFQDKKTTHSASDPSNKQGSSSPLSTCLPPSSPASSNLRQVRKNCFCFPFSLPVYFSSFSIFLSFTVFPSSFSSIFSNSKREREGRNLS